MIGILGVPLWLVKLKFDRTVREDKVGTRFVVRDDIGVLQGVSSIPMVNVLIQ